MATVRPLSYAFSMTLALGAGPVDREFTPSGSQGAALIAMALGPFVGRADPHRRGSAPTESLERFGVEPGPVGGRIAEATPLAAVDALERKPPASEARLQIISGSVRKLLALDAPYAPPPPAGIRECDQGHRPPTPAEIRGQRVGRQHATLR